MERHDLVMFVRRLPLTPPSSGMPTGLRSIAALTVLATLALAPKAAGATPNGTWLSKPQIWFYNSRQAVPQLMAQIRANRYRVVFLDYRNVDDAVQKQVAKEARAQGLIPVVWVQSPQYRAMSVTDLIHEARHADGIQVDDHFFANYSLAAFYRLRQLYTKPIFCSIQPFQAALVPRGGCNQLDVQCYTSQTFSQCLKLADRLGAVVSLSTANTLGQRSSLGARQFNTFLWPDVQPRAAAFQTQR
ncbi:conserved hypothetical protein [Cyanobium sp. PCC 7001]|nr:conserved hypothetical protein [Cyanobium sp. PCC 7001]